MLARFWKITITLIHPFVKDHPILDSLHLKIIIILQKPPYGI